jgi:protein gp37
MWILMEKTPFLDWLWLTKRPWNMVQYLKEHGTPEHFWAGTTVENQMAAEERIPFLLHCTKAKVRFLSMEPLLEKVLFRREWLDRYVDYPVGSTCHHYRHGDRSGDMESKINWIIIGAESLQKRPGRPMQATWVQTYVDLCACFGIPLFVKQGDVNGIISDSYLVKVGEEERLIKEIPEG